MSEESSAEIAVERHRVSVPVWRALFVVAGAIGGAILAYEGSAPLLNWIAERMALSSERNTGIGPARFALGLLGIIVGAGAGNFLVDFLGRIRDQWDSITSGGKVTVTLGTFFGLVASVPFLFFINTLFDELERTRVLPGSSKYAYLAVAMIVIILCFSLISVFVLRSIDDILPWNRAQARTKRRGIKILDTNVIIDGRIVDVARTGFLEGAMYVPGFVLDELQYIADSPDPLRRQRGRRGLDVLRLMQADFALEVRSQDKLAPDLGDGVDSRLVRLARAMGGDIVTNDFNLNRVALLQDVKVFNLNDLALSLRPNVLPSETLEITVIREGNQPGQGIGYLDDGTMVVVENGRPHIGEHLEVVVSQVIQTERGKMIFAHLDGTDGDPRRRQPGLRRP